MTGPLLCGIYIVDTSGDLPHRSQKCCVCVSASTDKYLPINTEHHENYDDFRIGALDYGFLNGVDRFLSCSRLFVFSPSKIKQKVGMLSEADKDSDREDWRI